MERESRFDESVVIDKVCVTHWFIITDEYGVAWCEEPFLTFIQAKAFMKYIQPQITLELKIEVHGDIRFWAPPFEKHVEPEIIEEIDLCEESEF